MTLARREVHACPDAQKPPPDIFQPWRYDCAECGAIWNWMPRRKGVSRDMWERYGFLGLRKRLVEVDDFYGGYWQSYQRMSRLVDDSGATDWQPDSYW